MPLYSLELSPIDACATPATSQGISPESQRESGIWELVARALKPKFRHTGLERRRLQPELIGGAADPANPPSCAVEHDFDVLFLDVCELYTAPCSGGGVLR